MLNDDRKRISGELLRAAADEFVCALRLAQGMNERLLDELKRALVDVGDAWKDDPFLPKTIVNDLVGLFAWIDSASYMYDGDEADRIKRAAMDVESLIFERVVPLRE